MEEIRKYKHSLIFSFLLFLFDRASKYYFFTNDQYLLNTGFSLGVFPGQNSASIIISILVLLMLLLIIVKYDLSYLLRNILVVIFVMGCSNILDRITYGGVIDFIDIGVIPVFNLADAVISISVIITLIILMKKDGEENIQSKN